MENENIEKTENKSLNMGNMANKLSTPMAIIIAGVIIAGAILVTKSPTKEVKNDGDVVVKPQEVKLEPVSREDHILGNRNAKVVVVEYSDTECPFCKVFHNTMHKVVAEYGNDIAWVYRHFPLDSIHSKARKEAEAAECANELGGSNAFWKYLDAIFEVTPSNNQLDLALLTTGTIPLKAGLDNGPILSKLEECIKSGKYAAVVEADYQSGVSAGVQGTPHSIILENGKQVDVIQGAEPFESVKAKIDALLK